MSVENTGTAAPVSPAAAPATAPASPAAPAATGQQIPNITVNVPPAQVAAPVAPPTYSPPPDQTVNIPLSQLQAFTSIQARLAEIEAQQRAQQEAAQQAQARLTIEKGQLEDGLRMLREQSEQALSAERQKLADIESRAKGYALDGEVARAMAGIPFHNDRARRQFEAEVRSELMIEAQGNTFVARTATFQTPAQLVQAKIDNPEYAYLLAPRGVAGTQGTGTTQAAPAPAADPAPVAPPTFKNLGHAWLAQAKENIAARQTNSNPLLDPSRPFGLSVPMGKG
jgi:hypothetical protein